VIVSEKWVGNVLQLRVKAADGYSHDFDCRDVVDLPAVRAWCIKRANEMTFEDLRVYKRAGEFDPWRISQ
jgi:hypothetical protein